MGAANDAYPFEKVKDVQAYDEALQAVDVQLDEYERYTAVQSEGAVLTVFFDNGYWEKPHGEGHWQAVAEEAIQDPKHTSSSLKYNISLLKPYQGELKPFDYLAAQIIPHQDPSTLKQGEKLLVTLYVDGKIAPDMDITADYLNDMTQKVKTNAQGQAELSVRNQGLNVIAAWVNYPTPEAPQAHLQRIVTTLSFKAAR